MIPNDQTNCKLIEEGGLWSILISGRESGISPVSVQPSLRRSPIGTAVDRKATEAISELRDCSSLRSRSFATAEQGFALIWAVARNDDDR